ncbi:MAG TPA: serine/threonine-protein kinase [Actinocrinis sp.]|nr:serine/threonine-protein kinase [Actinocrinis sp.]
MRGGTAVRVVAPAGVIADRYRILRPLGSGASASVWAAADQTLGRSVALKLLSDAAAADQRERERLRSEARALASLAHPHIVTVFDYLEAPGLDGAVQPVLVTELLEGESLQARLARGPLPWAEALSVCGELAEALAAAHRIGIVHRDVKPGNVMRTAGGAKLLDFGIAQGPAERGPTGGMAVGTPVCMAPEQLTGRGALPASDVYALGCVMHWCLTGRPPYPETDLAFLHHAHLHAAPPPLEVAELPEEINKLYARCLAKNPDQRPTADDVLGILGSHVHPPAAAPDNGDATQMLPAFPPADADAESAADAPRAPGRHAGPPVALDRRRLLPIGLLLGALGVIAVLMVGLDQMTSGSDNGAAPATSHGPSGAATGAGAAGASPTSTAGSIVLPSASASASPSASPSLAATASPAALPGLPNPATDPIGYLRGVSAQISALSAQGPATLSGSAAQSLQGSIAQLESAVGTAQQGSGKKQWRTVNGLISGIDQQLATYASNGQASPSTQSLLTGELRQLQTQLTGGGGNNNGG